MYKPLWQLKVEKNGRSLRTNVSINERLLKKIDQAARESGMTRSAYIAKAATEKMTRDAFSPKN